MVDLHIMPLTLDCILLVNAASNAVFNGSGIHFDTVRMTLVVMNALVGVFQTIHLRSVIPFAR